MVSPLCLSGSTEMLAGCIGVLGGRVMLGSVIHADERSRGMGIGLGYARPNPHKKWYKQKNKQKGCKPTAGNKQVSDHPLQTTNPTIPTKPTI